MEQVNIFDLTYNEDDGLYYLNGELFSGLAYSMRDGAFRDAEISYENGTRSGLTREWYSPGHLALHETYFDGMLHGSARSWYENGQLEEEGEYEYGVVLWEKSWDESGNILSSYSLEKDSSQYEFLQKLREIYRSQTD